MSLSLFIKFFMRVMAVFPAVSYAYVCTTLTPVTTISPPNITIQRDLPVGAQIGSVISTPVINAFRCSNATSPPIYGQGFGGKAYGPYLTTMQGRRIYRTNIAGIGYSVGISTPNTCPSAINWPISGDKDSLIVCGGDHILTDSAIQGRIHITFYKTAEITASGIVIAGRAASLILGTNDSWQVPEAYVNTADFYVTTLACSVNNTAISVPMGTVDKRSFSGTGTWPGESKTKSFNIPLTCNPGTRVNLQIDGSAQNATNGVLNLNSASNTATGVGVQLLYNDQPLALGRSFLVGTPSSSGAFNIALKSRYYQTASNITPGAANSSATFTLTYR